MKRITILFFALLFSSSVYTQTHLQDGDLCFDRGDYACAVTKYNEAFRIANGRDKQVAEIKLTRAKFCQDHIKAANLAFTNRQYAAAKVEYQSVLDSNPKDSYAQSQLEKCNSALNPAVTLSVSRGNLSFPASGGSENITVSTNKSPYSVNALPSWCTVQKYSGYFIITCSANSSTSVRNDYFTVGAGDKTVRINVSQSGKEEAKTATTLSVSKSNLSFSANGGSENITVSTNKSPYSVNALPSWCTVQKYSGYFIVTCSANSSTSVRNDYFTVGVGDKTVRINVSQSGKEEAKTATTLSVSKSNLSFSANGGSENITVTTNKSPYSVNALPSWCTIQKYSGYFIVTCSANSSTSVRNDYFTVGAGDKTVRINVSQSGKEETKAVTTLRVSKSDLWFPSSGGRSENILIYSNASAYSITFVPSWVKVERNSGFIVVVCTPNTLNLPRSDWFKIVAGEKEIKIMVNQSGAEFKYSSKKSYKVVSNTDPYGQYKIKKPFNSPKTKDTWGLTLGYANYYSGEGLQFGLKVEPLFKYGFGLNTGINLEAYAGNAWEALSKWEFEEYAVNIPLHLEYRLNFAKGFNMFFYGGAGFYAVTDTDFSDYLLPVTFDFGGGLRFNHVQFNVGRNFYLGDFRAIDSFGENIQPYQNYMVSISYMF